MAEPFGSEMSGGLDPLVSVIMPVFNASPYLQEALDSILRQTYARLEIIAIDDGSTDDSLQILERARASDSRVQIVSRENRGLIATLNEGLSLASGALIARMDADDISYPHRIARQVAAFRAEPQLGICGSGFDVLLGSRVTRYVGDHVVLTPRLYVLSMFFTVFKHSTVMFNRAALGDNLFYDTSYLHAEDFELFRRIIRSHPAWMIDESLIAYREHAQSVTTRHLDAMQMTHLRIVGESLEQEGFAFDRHALTRFKEELGENTVDAAAKVLLDLDAQVLALAEDAHETYRLGLDALFYFLYGIIRDARRPRLQHRFLTRSAKWGLLRRRERYVLRLASTAPRLAQAYISALHVLDFAANRLRSRPLDDRMPARPGGNLSEKRQSD